MWLVKRHPCFLSQIQIVSRLQYVPFCQDEKCNIASWRVTSKRVKRCLRIKHSTGTRTQYRTQYHYSVTLTSKLSLFCLRSLFKIELKWIYPREGFFVFNCRITTKLNTTVYRSIFELSQIMFHVNVYFLSNHCLLTLLHRIRIFISNLADGFDVKL